MRRLLRDRPLFDQSEKRFVRPDGEVVNAIVSVSLTADSNDRPQGYIWQVVDVTEQRHAEAERAARTEAEAVIQTIGKLQQITEAALAHLDLDELLEVLVERVGEVFGADVVRILLRDHGDEQRFTVGAATGLDVEPGTAVEIWARASGGRGARHARDPPGAAARHRARPHHRGRRGVLAHGVAAHGQGEGRGRGRGGCTRRTALHTRGREPPDPDGRPRRARDRARATSARLSNVEMLQRSLLPDRLPRIEGIQLAAVYKPGGADVGATGTTPSRWRAAAWAWPWATWWATASGRRR